MLGLREQKHRISMHVFETVKPWRRHSESKGVRLFQVYYILARVRDTTVKVGECHSNYECNQDFEFNNSCHRVKVFVNLCNVFQ